MLVGAPAAHVESMSSWTTGSSEMRKIDCMTRLGTGEASGGEDGHGNGEVGGEEDGKFSDSRSKIEQEGEADKEREGGEKNEGEKKEFELSTLILGLGV